MWDWDRGEIPVGGLNADLREGSAWQMLQEIRDEFPPLVRLDRDLFAQEIGQRITHGAQLDGHIRHVALGKAILVIVKDRHGRDHLEGEPGTGMAVLEAPPGQRFRMQTQ
jgi:hypothetical protein